MKANDEWLVGRSYISKVSMEDLSATRSQTPTATKTIDKEVGELGAA